MRDLDKALADILAIRSQIAAGTAFRGYGPATVAATGGIALLTASLQFLWLGRSDRPAGRVLRGPDGRRAVVGRADLDRDAGALAPPSFGPRRRDDPAGGRAIPAGRRRRLPAWRSCCGSSRRKRCGLLPGLWQILVSLGVFASVRSLPRSIAFGGAWYFVVRVCDAAAREPKPSCCRPGPWACHSPSVSS